MSRGRFAVLRCAMKGVEAVMAESRHSFPRHTHDQFGIGLVTEGAHRSLSGRGTVEAGAGDMITVNPGEVHDGAPVGGAGRTWAMLYFDPEVVGEALGDMRAGGAGAEEIAHPVIRDTRLATGFRRLFARLTEAEDDTLESEQLLLGLLSGVMGEAGGEAQSAPAQIRHARGRIDDDPAAAVSLAELAAEAGLSRFQLLRGFSRATGMTPHAYLIQRRAALARRLIAGGSGLADAAIAAGFADQSHMTRVFVRTYGMTPGVYAGGH